MNKLYAFLLFVCCVVVTQPAHAGRDIMSPVGWATAQMEIWEPGNESMRSNYASIARDALRVAFDPQESPLFAGPQGRLRTFAAMMATASYESHFRQDVDTGEMRGDSGKSWCLMQIQLGNPNPLTHRTGHRVVLRDDIWSHSFDGQTGWGGEDLVQDRQKCFRVALHMMRASMRYCRNLPLAERLSIYTSGNCHDGRAASRIRMRRAAEWLVKFPAPGDDIEVASVVDFN